MEEFVSKTGKTADFQQSRCRNKLFTYSHCSNRLFYPPPLPPHQFHSSRTPVSAHRSCSLHRHPADFSYPGLAASQRWWWNANYILYHPHVRGWRWLQRAGWGGRQEDQDEDEGLEDGCSLRVQDLRGQQGWRQQASGIRLGCAQETAR